MDKTTSVIAPNRTILELKLASALSRNVESSPPNRTILELKHIKSRRIKVRRCLQIAPYWNWNKHSKFHPCIHNHPPNRTILELKRSLLSMFCWKLYSPNRTILELKRKATTCFLAAGFISKSHHTGIETIKKNKNIFYSQLQIAPYWNWNGLIGGSVFDNTISKSHHTGIETLIENIEQLNKKQLQIAPYWNWNIRFSSFSISAKKLQIAPYWNWNRFCCRLQTISNRLQIAPYWNWNRICEVSTYEYY